MSKMPRLTEKSEKQISDTLSKAAALTNDGMSPDDAIVKVATEAKLPAGQVRLMVSAFNNGRSLGHIRNNESLSEKAASFELASASNILERMFPSDVKTASAKQHSSEISGDYNMAPSGWLKRRAQASVPAMSKVAADGVCDVCGKHIAKEDQQDRTGCCSCDKCAYDQYEHRAEKKAVAEMQRMRRDAEAARTRFTKAGYDVVRNIEKVASYFRQPDALPWKSVRTNIVAARGPVGERFMDKVAADHKIVLKRTGEATHPLNWREAPYSLIKDALDSMKEFQNAKSALIDFEKEALTRHQETMRPFAETRGTPVITGSVWDNRSLNKEAVGMLGLGIAGGVGGAARGMAEKLAPKNKEQLVQDRLQELSSPKHEDKLRAIRAQTMIHEMMAADPIISGYPQADVFDAFNHLSEVAPRAMQHRIMAQSLIRKYLEQATALDPFDSDQMLDIESKMIRRDMPDSMTGHFSPGGMRELGPPVPKPDLKVNAPPKPPNPIDSAFPE